MSRPSLSKRIRDIMQREGINQQELASFLGISQPAISLYLSGRIPPAEVLYKISQIGKTTVEWLLTGNEYSAETQVQEKTVFYGNQHQLLELWALLSSSNQKILLSLMRQLAEK